MNDNVKKITKRESYIILGEILNAAEAAGIELTEGLEFSDLHDFLTHEIELLDNKTAAAARRNAAKKAEGDKLRQTIYDLLDDEVFKTVNDIVAELGDKDISAQMVTSRLTQLKELDKVEKEMTSYVTESGRTKKLVSYRKLA